MNILDYIKEWANTNPGKAVGACTGFIAGIFIIVLGIKKTVFVILFVAIGFIIGKMRDENISPLDQIKGLFKRKDE